MYANEGQSTSAGQLSVPAAVDPLVAGHTFTVTNAGDTPDAAPGDGTCADSSGNCTLRAAMNEAEYLKGDDRIEFNLPGTAPVRIQIASRLPFITSLGGTMTIDAYTEPGSSPNTLQFGSNAIPGIELRGNGNAAREVGFYITSPGNTIRGFNLNNLYRPIFVDGSNAHDNLIIGNQIGFQTNGNSAAGNYGIILNTGAHDNHVGTPALADRNQIGYAGMDNYGPGTDRNVIQNNIFCIRPSGAHRDLPDRHRPQLRPEE